MSDDEQSGPTPRRPPTALAPFLGGLAVGVVVVAMTWGLMAVVSSGPPDEGSADQTFPRAALNGRQVTRSAPDPRDRCIEAATLLTSPLRRVRPAMGQWEVHVGAMNKLVVGAITLPQATAFWNSTRVRAHLRIEAFERALAPIARQGLDCPTPDLVGTNGSPELRACSQQVAAMMHQLGAARIALTTWKHHVREMDLLRQGKISGADASRMWLSMWRQGVAQIAAYRTAAQAARQQRGCNGTWHNPSPHQSASPSSPSTGPMDPMGSMDPMDSTDSMP